MSKQIENYYRDDELKKIGLKIKYFIKKSVPRRTQNDIGVNVFGKPSGAAQSFVKRICLGDNKDLTREDVERILDYINISVDEFDNCAIVNNVVVQKKMIDLLKNPSKEAKSKPSGQKIKRPFDLTEINKIKSDLNTSSIIIEDCGVFIFDDENNNAIESFLKMWATAYSMNRPELQKEITRDLLTYVMERIELI